MNNTQFDHKDYWKGIVLYGLNAATYKMALANLLLDFAEKGQTFVDWPDLSFAFLQQYQNRLANNHMPQQGNPSRLTVMERVIKGVQCGGLSITDAVDTVGLKGLDNVIPRFQTIGTNKEIVSGRFYDFEYGKRLILKDALLAFTPEECSELREELIARWGLLEGAFSLTQKDYALANDIREIYLKDAYDRKPLTNNIPFLSGYQGNVCFYCGEILCGTIHVDHVLPRQVLQHDEIWNLVLSHDHCNQLKLDRLVGPHFIKKLIARNENIMGSNHPWKQKIATALGSTAATRRATLLKHYENVKTVLGSNWWGGSDCYNPATDPFYRRLITVLNNG